jgi:two-component system, chemotaxis family, protein-glutamate methylesterase/glutaminase
MTAGTKFDIVAIASSAGGLTALGELLSALPPSFPAAVLVVQHVERGRKSALPEILARQTALRAKHADDGEPVHAGVIYIAPPDEHLLVNADCTISLSHTELVHFVRPSADLLFESVAASYGPRAIAVVLTGTGSDGALGSEAIKRMGGYLIAQDEATSAFFGMPGATIRLGHVDAVLPIDAIAPALIKLTGGVAA